MKGNSIGLFGNRQSRATTERLEHYRYDPESGRLRQRIPDRAYEYDAGGRTTEDGRWRYRYGAHGRLAEITRVATGQRQAAYRYNALGERVRKLGTRVTYYHYDLEGRLLAETDAGGQTRAEYLYLGHAPLALSRSGQLYYYHNDHLGTPQKLTDGAGQVVWSARYRPFGEASIGAGYVTQNLRFPGQYYDEESGLHYNYHRYYDPGTGRYLTSDPIGLQGGLNTYTYALNNPLKFIDPTGLSTAVVHRGNGTITVTMNNGQTVTYPAGNNTTNPSGDPNTLGSNGPAPTGTWPVQSPVNTSGDVRYGPYFWPIGAVDAQGNRTDIARQRGIGLHGGRRSHQSRTQGCVRMDDADILDLYQRTTNDPLTTIEIR